MSSGHIIDVSPEMITVIGDGADGAALPAGSAVLLISLDSPASLQVHADADRREWEAACGERTIALVVMQAALDRLFAWSARQQDGAAYFLTADIAGIADQLIADRHRDDARSTYRLGKSIELLCEIVPAIAEGRLTRAHDGVSLSQRDSERLGSARAIIEQHWAEKLTINQIARRCGLNRTKLSRGFRELYQCSVTEALAEKRLGEARRQLIATDLPVSVIGYRSGYANNASFTRAFGRRFGQSPSQLRSCGVAG